MFELGVGGTRDQDRDEETEAKPGCRLDIFYVLIWTYFILFTLFYVDMI
jgi:hypothetical protein